MAMTGLDPQLAAAILHVLLDDPLLPASRPVAELRGEQVMAAQGLEAGVDGPFAGTADAVHGGLHVVVDAAARDATQRLEGAGVGIEQHLVALHRIGHQPEGAAAGQLEVGDVQAHPLTANHRVLAAPVELEGLAGWEQQRHEGRPDGIATAFLPLADERSDPGVAAGITAGLQLGEQGLGSTALPAWPVAVGPQPSLQLLTVRVQPGRRGSFGVDRLGLAAAQPAPDGVAGQAGASGDLAHRQAIAEMHPPDLGQHDHRYHS